MTAEIAAFNTRIATLEGLLSSYFVGEDVFFGDNPVNAVEPLGTHAADHDDDAIPPQDWWFDARDGIIYCRTMKIEEMEDPPEIPLAYWQTATTGVPAGTIVGQIRARAQAETTAPYDCGIMYFETTQLTTNAGGTGGKWVVGNTPNGDFATIPYLSVDHDGGMVLTSDEDFSDFLYTILCTRSSGSQKGLKVDVRQNNGNIILQLSHNGTKVLEVLSNDKIGMFGATPVVKAAAISNPTADATMAAIILVLKNLGVTA